MTTSRRITYTNEGRVPGMPDGERGWVAECECTWIVWTATRIDTDKRANAHRCKSGAK